MGQGTSSETVPLETRVDDPTDGHSPIGLAVIAHGRLGGDFNQPPVRLLAEYLRDFKKLRVITWNARGIGKSEGLNEWSDLGVWMGDAGVNDYNRVLRETMSQFVEQFPETSNAPLFICGYSAGAIYAGCTRPSPSFTGHFLPARYIFISYPVALNPFIGLGVKSGSYFRSVEALVHGSGWENLPAEFNGEEPEVSGVLTITGGYETFVFYGTWTWCLGNKNSRKVLTQVLVDGASHDWGGKADCIVNEVAKWLSSP